MFAACFVLGARSHEKDRVPSCVLGVVRGALEPSISMISAVLLDVLSFPVLEKFQTIISQGPNNSNETSFRRRGLRLATPPTRRSACKDFPKISNAFTRLLVFPRF